MNNNISSMINVMDTMATSALKSRITTSISKLMDKYERILDDDAASPEEKKQAEQMILAMGGAVLQ